jgi:hypothetical protein
MGASFGPWRRRRAHRLIRIFRGPFSRKEADMLLHLPIVVMATLSPVAVSDTVPKFDIVRECRLEGGSTVELERCSENEGAALRASTGVGAICRRRQEELHCLRDNRRFRKLCRAFDVSGNGPRCHQCRQQSARFAYDRCDATAPPGVTVGLGSCKSASRRFRVGHYQASMSIRTRCLPPVQHAATIAAAARRRG